MLSVRSCLPKRTRGCPLEVRRSIFITDRGFYESTPRHAAAPVLPPCVTLGRHHKPFGSAGTARGLRALDLVRAAPRNVARRAPWAPEKGVDQDRRIIHTTVAPPACSGEPPERPYRRIDTGPAQHQLCGLGGHVSHRHRTLQEEVRRRPPKHDSRVPAHHSRLGPWYRIRRSHPTRPGRRRATRAR
eukprot:scaffold89506_cov63-Phaeocystis_antarctica.AAC.4